MDIPSTGGRDFIRLSYGPGGRRMEPRAVERYGPWALLQSSIVNIEVFGSLLMTVRNAQGPRIVDIAATWGAVGSEGLSLTFWPAGSNHWPESPTRENTEWGHLGVH
jgi:hypothetical protein